ncbi:MAG: hypothetical protein AAFQ82_24210 [Myxococcota bacterium]
MRITRSFVLWIGLTAACGEATTFEDTQTLVAALDNETLLLGVELTNGEVDAYVCGDADRFQTFSRWYRGELLGPEEFRIAVDDWVLEGRIEDDAQRIELRTPEGNAFEGALSQIAADGRGGIFENNDFGCRSGAVLVPLDGEIVTQGARCIQDGLFDTQVTPVRLPEGPIERFEAQAGDDSFFMDRVR